MNECFNTLELEFPKGRIMGRIRHTIYELPFYSFEGIPYAKPPVGKLRFKDPEEIRSWSGVLDCTACKNKPMQTNLVTKQIEGSEDCLYLNVYVKLLKTDKPLPVMVYIYGGLFIVGGATNERIAPDYFMNEHIVLVTFNYRLGSLGFLSFKDPHLGIPGNSGLKDQLMVLNWINEYISYFNGDPGNVTLFGESAGGASTHFMCLTPKAEGLFHRAILMSGCALGDWTVSYSEDLAYRLCKHNGYTGENNDEKILEFLRSLEPEKLIVLKLFTDEEFFDSGNYTFKPVIEAYPTRNSILLKSPFELLPTAWSNRIPMMIGGTSYEGLFMNTILRKHPECLKVFENEFHRLLPEQIRKTRTEEEIAMLSKTLRQSHFGDKAVNEQNKENLLDLFSYKYIFHSLHRVVLARLKYAANASTYLYCFEYHSSIFNFHRILYCGSGSYNTGAAHGDDLDYLFLSEQSYKLQFNSSEYKIIRNMILIWTSFARDSDPSCHGCKPAIWLPLSEDNPYEALKINRSMEVSDLKGKPKLEVWHSLYKKEELY